MRIALLSLAGLLLFGISSAAAEPDAAIAGLGSRSYAEREAATKALDALGTAALPALEKVRAESANAEVQLRVAGLIARIRRRADSIALIQTKSVSFDFRDRPLSSAVADLRSTTGIPLVLDPSVRDRVRPITLKVDELPPWRAIERFCEAAGLRDTLAPNAKPETKSGRSRLRSERLETSFDLPTGPAKPPDRPDEIAIVLVDGKDPTPVDSTGGVRIRALPMSYAGPDRASGEVKLHFDVAPQPGMNWIRTKEIRVGRATGAMGRQLSVAHKPEAQAPPVGPEVSDIAIEHNGEPVILSTRTNARAVPVTFRADERDGKTIRSLEGLIVGEVAKANRPILTVEDIAACGGQIFDCQGSTLTVVSLTSDAKSGSTKLVLGISGVSNLDGVQQAMPMAGSRPRSGDVGPSVLSIKNIRYYDAEGRMLKQPVQQGMIALGDGFRESIEFTLRFGSASSNIAPKPVRLIVWGTEIVTVEVPFKLKDVPLE